jgi:SRSO17 transposase
MVFKPQETALEAMVPVANTGKTGESSVAAARRLVGLDDYEVRSWTGWYRHITLAMWAYAILNVMRPDALAGEAANSTTGPCPRQSSLAAFKASRGLGLH